MGRSQETSGKKEIRTKKEKKRKDKEKKRALKKTDGKSASFDDMIAYVDEFGRITSVPPDPNNKVETIAENIQINISRNRQEDNEEALHKGVVTFYNEAKGFGFIRDFQTSQKIFVHANSLSEAISEDNIVVYKIVKGVKGPSAIKVKIFRE